ncbi:DnaD domain protein [Facklamia sp. DSM 111018]|uniref:DnaD domain protein n=1 Tax=Facklamia lactis TaxID=2749967 RepID=A0ABS0LMU3_9LACT|nr:DnaD domain protein [Facklamia lactis]MBG9979852.1 DnaD domain protein [Facklamia lactis]MBG9985468.1 DnaD domain protein [Facklamia lactis]
MGTSIYDWMKTGYTIVPNVFIKHFAKLKLNSDEFVVIVYLLQHLNQSQPVSTIVSIADQLGWESDQLYATLNSLMDKNYLNIELVPNKEGKQTDHYTLRPLFESLDADLNSQKEKSQEVVSKPTISTHISQEKELKQLISLFEKEFGRVLSNLELETINTWVHQDHYPIELITAALKEAILRQAYNLKYIDRILLNWQNQNIKTVEEAQIASQNFQKKQNQQSDSSQSTFQKIDIPIIDWDKR